MPARPENVSLLASRGHREPRHLREAAGDEPRSALSPSCRLSAPPAARSITFFAAGHSSTPITSSLT